MNRGAKCTGCGKSPGRAGATGWTFISYSGVIPIGAGNVDEAWCFACRPDGVKRGRLEPWSDEHMAEARAEIERVMREGGGR